MSVYMLVRGGIPLKPYKFNMQKVGCIYPITPQPNECISHNIVKTCYSSFDIRSILKRTRSDPTYLLSVVVHSYCVYISGS